jgi:hypothetical protein
MLIEWTIDKKRGNIRPVLSYTVTLEDHEKALALPSVCIESIIPEPADSWQEYCHPGQCERAGAPHKGVYRLESPSHKGRSHPQTLRLPWREDNTYPEVEESFAALRDALEKELAAAYASAPVQERGALHTRTAAKALIAPGLVAERLLAFAQAGRAG